MSEIKKVFVVGAGLMGRGIAQVAAEGGFQTTLHDVTLDVAQKGLAAIEKILQRNVDKGKLPVQDRDAILGRLRPVASLEMASDADLVFEVVTENFGIKSAIFKELDQTCHPQAILATNTSSISITKIAAVTKRPDKVIGMHFFNPVPMMPVVEIIPGISTSKDTLEIAKAVAAQMRKEVIQAKDYPAFLLNRILLPMLNEAYYCLMEGQASAEDIDTGMKMAMGHPMGPLRLSDLIGLDTILSVFEVMYEGYGESKYYPCPLLRKLVEAGHYGVKSGRGFYDYSQK